MKKAQIFADEEDLFGDKKTQLRGLPLALRMRPRDLSEFVGQDHILGKGKLLRRAIEADRISSLILYGPPACGKTSLAYCISTKTHSFFQRLNAVESNIEQLRQVIFQAKTRRANTGQKTILFIDEIHRFNKAVQDILMPNLEEGNPVLIGATVHNPFFYLTSTLLSRSLVFELKALRPGEIMVILKRALADKERGLGSYPVRLDKEALEHIARNCEGDARRALNALELGILTAPKGKKGVIHFNLKISQESLQKKALVYDRNEDAHYDTISAFIKSMRGSDPDAALYWLAKMIYAGEDPRFIARRICICAAEDVGNANPQALVLANAALQVAEFIGMPEARIPLAQAAVYVATSPKSNAAYIGIEKALDDVTKQKVLEVPDHLKDASYPGAKRLGRGKDYKYPHSYKGHVVKQSYLPKRYIYYKPSEFGYERIIKAYLDKVRSFKQAGDTGE
jgi:putative ATPase